MITVNGIEKTKKKEKEARNCTIFRKKNPEADQGETGWPQNYQSSAMYRLTLSS